MCVTFRDIFKMTSYKKAIKSKLLAEFKCVDWLIPVSESESERSTPPTLLTMFSRWIAVQAKGMRKRPSLEHICSAWALNFSSFSLCCMYTHIHKGKNHWIISEYPSGLLHKPCVKVMGEQHLSCHFKQPKKATWQQNCTVTDRLQHLLDLAHIEKD